MFEYLLINVEDLEVRRNAFDSIWFINLSVYLLQSFVQWLHLFCIVAVKILNALLPDILLPIEKSPSI